MLSSMAKLLAWDVVARMFNVHCNTVRAAVKHFMVAAQLSDAGAHATARAVKNSDSFLPIFTLSQSLSPLPGGE
jgi:hypothetical protein